MLPIALTVLLTTDFVDVYNKDTEGCTPLLLPLRLER